MDVKRTDRVGRPLTYSSPTEPGRVRVAVKTYGPGRKTAKIDVLLVPEGETPRRLASEVFGKNVLVDTTVDRYGKRIGRDDPLDDQAMVILMSEVGG